MSADRAHTLGVTREEIDRELAELPPDDDPWTDPDERPAAWRAFGEDPEEQK